MTLLSFTTHPETIPEWLPTGIILLILVLLYVIYLLFNRRNKKESFIRFTRYFLLPFTFLSGLAVYFWGYQIGNSHCNPNEIIPNLLESTFSTARLFILGNDLIEINPMFKHDEMFHAMFALTAFLAAFIFISFMAHVFFKDWITRGRIKRMKPTENHFFFGINHAALSLSSDLAEKGAGRLVAFVNDFCEFDDQHQYAHVHENACVIKRKSIFESINLEKEEGLLQLFKSKENHKQSEAFTEGVFHRLSVLKNKIKKAETHLYFLSDNDDWNIKQARQAISELVEMEEVEKRRDHEFTFPSVKIHVVTYDEISEKHFTTSLTDLPGFILVIVHNYATLVSRKLIEQFHPVDFIGIDSKEAAATTDFNALIIGFGQIGTHVLRKLIEQGQFVGSTFKATVIDRLIPVQEGRFDHLYPGVKANYDVQFVEAEVGHRAFYETIRGLIDQTKYIVIALGQDELNIQTALEILEINSKNEKKLFIQLEDESHWKETLKKYESQIRIFGASDEVFSEKNILQRDVEMSGRLVHQVYNILYNCDDSFDKVSRHEQLSNISAAEHLYAKVRLLGYKNLNEFSSKFENNDAYVASLSKSQELNLSVGEHLRWNAFHFIHGWTTLPMDEIPGNTQEEKYKNRKNTALRLHSCLISWEDLVRLKQIIGRDMQIADTDSVRHLYDFINYHSYEN